LLKLFALLNVASGEQTGTLVPSLETLEKFAHALEIPIYQLMYDGDEPPGPPGSAKKHAKNPWESSRAGVRLMDKLIPLLAKMNQPDRDLILFLAGKVVAKRDKKYQRALRMGMVTRWCRSKERWPRGDWSAI